MAHGSGTDRPPRRYRFAYHYREWALTGSSGAGKTTLAEALLARWTAQGLRIGYAKHDAHGFTLDTPGKDTWRASQAGADLVSIRHGDRIGVLGTSPDRPHNLFLPLDGVMAEGHHQTRMPKLLVLDEAGEGLRRLRDGELTEVTALVGTGGGPMADPALGALGLPWFHRDDIGGVATFIEERFLAPKPVLHGLVLAGGRSVRMGADKAAMRFGGETQVDRAIRLLAPLVDRAFLSIRHDQASHPWAESRACIADSIQGIGPLSGIISALQSDPAAAWLVVACDQPLLDTATLERLVALRRHTSLGTAFRSPHDGRPEPLCAIYEPHAYPLLMQQVGMDQLCPRGILEFPGVVLADPPRPEALVNMNTPEDAALVASRFSGGRPA